MIYKSHLISNFHEDISSSFLLGNIFPFSTPKESLVSEVELTKSGPKAKNTFFGMIENDLLKHVQKFALGPE